MFLKRSLQVATIGLAVGFVASTAFSRWMGSLLYDVRPLDPTTYVVVLGILLAAVALATYLPARRAARLDPAVTLRAHFLLKTTTPKFALDGAALWPDDG